MADLNNRHYQSMSVLNCAIVWVREWPGRCFNPRLIQFSDGPKLPNNVENRGRNSVKSRGVTELPVGGVRISAELQTLFLMQGKHIQRTRPTLAINQSITVAPRDAMRLAPGIRSL